MTESLSLNGTVIAQEQQPITYSGRGSVANIKVKVGQSVAAGDVLIDFDANDTTRDLGGARYNLETARAKLADGQAQVAARATVQLQQQANEQKRQQLAIQDAEAGLRRAEENLALTRAGQGPGAGPAQDRQAQSTAVIHNQLEVDRLQRALLDALAAGPDEEALRAGRREIANDEIALTRAKADLDALTRGPDPAALRAAQATVQRAQTLLQLAQAAKVDPKAPDPAVARIQLDAAIQDAQIALSNAETQVTKLKQPPSDIDVQAARQRVQDAQDLLETAQAKQTTLEAGPTQAQLGDASAALEGARHTLAEAQASLDQINSHPTPAELAAAQDQVRVAQRALENARQPAPPSTDPFAVDLPTLEKGVSQAEAAVATLEQTLEATHFRAPFEGTVVAVNTKLGDVVTQSKPVMIIAKPGRPIVRLTLDDAQAQQLDAGLQAAVQIGADPLPGAPQMSAKVESVTRAAADGSTSASANLDVTWLDGQVPRFGAPVVALVTLRQKDALVVPKSAVRQSGGRSTVEVLDGSLRRIVPVQVGITTDASVEILSGVAEGQFVLAVTS